MSQATLELILSELRNFREEVNEEFQLVRKEAQEIRAELKAEIRTEVQSLRAEMQTEVGSLKTEVLSLRAEMQTEVGSLKTEMQSLRAEMQSLRAEIQAVRTELMREIDAVKKEQVAIHKRLDSMEELYAQLIGLIKSLKEEVAKIAERQAEQEQRFSFQLHSQAASIEILHREQLALKTEIELLKSRK